MQPTEAAGSGRAELKAWQAHASAAIDYFQEHGGENMHAEERYIYERLLCAVQEEADRHTEARGGTRGE